MAIFYVIRMYEIILKMASAVPETLGKTPITKRCHGIGKQIKKLLDHHNGTCTKTLYIGDSTQNSKT